MVILPDWMQTKDDYVPPKDGGTFVIKTIKSLGMVLSRLKMQSGHEKARHLPVSVKFFLLLFLILLLALAREKLIFLAVAAVVLLYLSTWPAKDILNIFKASFTAGIISLIMLIPAMFIKPEGMSNYLLLIVRVFLSMMLISIFNHTTQWNSITFFLRKIHVPGIFIFTLDITIKYLVLLGNLINDLLESVLLRSVGKNNKKYSSIGGVMGITFIKGTELNSQMYEAMKCRGFTDDYRGL